MFVVENNIETDNTNSKRVYDFGDGGSDLEGDEYLKSNNRDVSENVKSDGSGSNNTSTKISNENEEIAVSNDNPDKLPPLSIFLPEWGYSDYITDRISWQKGLTDVGGEVGFFYFKIFFHFNTMSGLFGGLLNTYAGRIKHGTSAYSFLSAWDKHFPSLRLSNRLSSLQTFAKSLNNISNTTPWFFQSVSGLDKAQINLNEPFKDNELEIKCLEESIDMRLSSLFEYYKYACYDYVNLREIIPENLRKFDMSIVVFGVPIRYLDTHSKINSKEYMSRTLRGDNGNKMTATMYTFKECEFDVENMSEFMSGEAKNDAPFKIEGNTIKIKYKKVFNYKQNGFTNSVISSLIGYKDSKSDVSSRLSKIAEAYKLLQKDATASSAGDNFVNKYISSKTKFSKWYKFARNMGAGSSSRRLVDETEAMCQDLYNNISENVFNFVTTKTINAGDLGSITPPEMGVNTSYYKEKIKKMHDGTLKAGKRVVPNYTVPTFAPSSNSNNNNNSKSMSKSMSSLTNANTSQSYKSKLI